MNWLVMHLKILFHPVDFKKWMQTIPCQKIYGGKLTIPCQKMTILCQNFDTIFDRADIYDKGKRIAS